MKSDIEIAQEAELVHIKKVAEKLGINEDELEFYGKYKAKISDELWESVKDREDGKLGVLDRFRTQEKESVGFPDMVAGDWPISNLLSHHLLGDCAG